MEAGLDELKDHEDKEIDWDFEKNKQAEALKGWTVTGEIPETVDWPRGMAAASTLNTAVRKWRNGRLPSLKNVSSPELDEEDTEKVEKTSGRLSEQP